MSESQVVHTDRAPAAIGPYSQGMWAGDLFFSAGQIGLDPETGDLVEGGMAEEARRALENLRAVLEVAGLRMSHVVKTTVYISSMDEFSTVNELCSLYFEEPFPARSTVEVAGLPRGASVEIEVVARRP